MFRPRLARLRRLSGLVALFMIAAVPAAAGGLSDYLSAGSLQANARYRYEGVQQDGIARDADAQTIRVRAAYQTPMRANLQALIEVEATGRLAGNFNDTVNGHTAYPVVADPNNLEINRLQLLYAGLPQTEITLGRQEINLDDQRFVGAVAFRQNEQTFDALRVTNHSIRDLTLTYVYVNRVNRVFGWDSPAGHFNTQAHLFNAGYALGGIGTLSAYAYLLDINSAPRLSTQTYGMALTGKQKLGDELTVSYRAEAATQHAYANNPLSFDLAYLRGELGLASGLFSAAGGVEYLEGNGTIGFATPLATLHKFQGFADVFLTTPAGGITDAYGTIGVAKKDLELGPITGASLAGWYHDFQSTQGGSLGSEFDIGAALHWGTHVTTSLTYASYSGVAGYASRDKIWLAVDLKI